MFCSLTKWAVVFSFLIANFSSSVLSRKIKMSTTEPSTTILMEAETYGIEDFDNKTSVLFLCRDSLFRSPMLKVMLKQLLRQTNQLENWIVDSACIGFWDIGKEMDPRAKEWLISHHFPDTNHRVRKITMDDYYKFQYIIATDEVDYSYLQMARPKDSTVQLFLLGSFNQIHRYPGKNYLDDPFYLKTKDFVIAMSEIVNKGFWFLVGFLDTFGIKVPTTTARTKKPTTSPKPKTPTTPIWKKFALKYSLVPQQIKNASRVERERGKN